MSSGKWVHHETEEETWITHDEFETKEDAIKAGKQEYEGGFFVGKAKMVDTPVISGSCDILEVIQERVYDQVGEVAEDYLGAEVTREQEKELEKEINDAILKWMKKYNHLPQFWTIDNIEEVSNE